MRDRRERHKGARRAEAKNEEGEEDKTITRELPSHTQNHTGKTQVETRTTRQNTAHGTC